MRTLLLLVTAGIASLALPVSAQTGPDVGDVLT